MEALQVHGSIQYSQVGNAHTGVSSIYINPGHADNDVSHINDPNGKYIWISSTGGRIISIVTENGKKRRKHIQKFNSPPEMNLKFFKNLEQCIPLRIFTVEPWDENSKDYRYQGLWCVESHGSDLSTRDNDTKGFTVFRTKLVPLIKKPIAENEVTTILAQAQKN